MNIFFYTASAVAFLIFLMAVPFDVNSHTAVSLKRKFVVENISLLGLISLAFSLSVKDGIIYWNGNEIKKGNKKKDEFKIDVPDLMGVFDIVSVNVRGAFGNASDAAATAMISSSIIMILTIIKNTKLINSRTFAINFTPLYHKNIFDLDIKIKVKVNVFMIIFSVLKILRKR